MSTAREIKTQIASIHKIQTITGAMQSVAASKMRRAREHMESTQPYAKKIKEVVAHVADSQCDYTHPYLEEREEIKKVGYIVVSTDRGLCGGLNLNLFKGVLEHAKEFQDEGVDVEWCLFGKKAVVSFRNILSNVVAHTSDLGDRPKVADILGGIKVMLDAYRSGEIDRLFIANNEFVSTMVQKSAVTQLLPIVKLGNDDNYSRTYIYEPGPIELLNSLLHRYIEAQVYQAVVDNIACEQVARMIAMKNATDNSEEIINDLYLLYNKARQATITREIAEIVGGADAVS